jgi:hypothetical protein
MHYIKTTALILLILTCIKVKSYAQESLKIRGSIIANNDKINGATASLIDLKDTSTIKLAISNKEGEYYFEKVNPGMYRVMVTAVGYQRAMSANLEINPQQKIVTVPPIALKPAVKELANVTVTATRPLIEQKIDRTILNVDAAITNIGASALEILEKAPGVTVDREGNISLKGKEGVMVMIDGRPAQLSGEDLANMLRSMTSTQMDQIEIMTNPSARYDAAGNAGIINIKTKKMVNAGYNGTASVNYMQGRYPKINEGLNINYRKQKVNVFANISHSYRKSFETNIIQRNIRNGDNTLINYFDQRANKLVNANSLNAKLGLDFFVSKKFTAGITLNGATNSASLNNLNTTNIFTASKEIENTTNADVENYNRAKRFMGNIYFRQLLNTKGREITGDLDFISFNATTELNMVNAYPYANGNGSMMPDTLIGYLPQNIKVYSGRVDYVHPLSKNARIEAGFKSSIVRTDNNAKYDSVQNGMMVPDVNRSNHFIYEENINAAYVNMVKPFNKKLSAQLGLRLENTNAIGRQLTNNKNFDRHYTQLFPTAYLQYRVNEKHTLVANYGKRVQRPNYQSLNPFIRFIDRYTYSEGNPNLTPAISNNYELTHSYANKITTIVNYTATNDIINQVIEQQGRVAYTRPFNIASLRQVGMSISANNNLTKWWKSNLNANVFHNRYRGVVNNAMVDLSATSYIINLTQQFRITNSFSAELSGRYRSGWLEGVLHAEPIGFVWAGVSKQIMKNNGTIRVTVRDIFYTQKFKGSARYGNVDFRLQEVNDSRLVILGFTYKFNKGKKIAPVKRTPRSTDEEEGRIDQ